MMFSYFQVSSKATVRLVCSLILYLLDYSNTLLFGLLCILLNKLQLEQNNAARLVTDEKKEAWLCHSPAKTSTLAAYQIEDRV